MDIEILCERPKSFIDLIFNEDEVIGDIIFMECCSLIYDLYDFLFHILGNAATFIVRES